MLIKFYSKYYHYTDNIFRKKCKFDLICCKTVVGKKRKDHLCKGGLKRIANCCECRRFQFNFPNDDIVA